MSINDVERKLKEGLYSTKWECNTHVAGAGGNGQKFSGSGMKKTVLRRALV